MPASGIVGWKFLQRTYDQQVETFSDSARLKRDADYFAERIGSVTTASDLVSDRRLLRVALGAFGLEEDIDSKAFVQKILSDGTDSRDALARRLSDERYTRFSDAFGFGSGQTLQTGRAGFAAEIVEQFTLQSFEAAVGDQDESMRVALYALRELEIIADKGSSDRAQWFTLMSLPPLRELFETALGFPSEFNQLDVEKQQDIFREKSRRVFGTDKISELLAPDRQEKLINTYLAREQINTFRNVTSSAAIALTLLQGA
ncbi:MAG: DUF1217 domain-containing protein [Rhodobacteraceae bacterium]|nr:DUF1217 domain-containing protein [Paracoccaceae bacterium]